MDYSKDKSIIVIVIIHSFMIFIIKRERNQFMKNCDTFIFYSCSRIFCYFELQGNALALIVHKRLSSQVTSSIHLSYTYLFFHCALTTRFSTYLVNS